MTYKSVPDDAQHLNYFPVTIDHVEKGLEAATKVKILDFVGGLDMPDYEVPDTVAALKNLEEIHITGVNNLKLSDAVSRTSITTLELSQIHSLNTDAISYIASLSHLNKLILEELSEQIDAEVLIQALRKLTYLTLSSINLENLTPAIAQVNDLEYLDVSCNFLTTLPQSLGCLNKLQYLDISVNRLDDFPRQIAELGSLRTLKYRQLEKGTKAQHKIMQVPSCIDKLINLERLELDGHRIIDITTNIRKLKNLKHLSLHGNNLDEFPDAICHLPRLEYLCISNNPIDHIPEAIIQLETLKELNLLNTAIKEVPKVLLERGVNVLLS